MCNFVTRAGSNRQPTAAKARLNSGFGQPFYPFICFRAVSIMSMLVFMLIIVVS